MNRRRHTLLWLLILLVGLPLVAGDLGTVEVGIWLLLLAAWVVAFFTWAKPRGAQG